MIHVLFLIIFIFFIPVTAKAIDWPTGLYATELNNIDILSHRDLKGVMITAKWKDIEPRIGEYHFETIQKQAALVRQYGKQWILVIQAGPHSPHFIKKSGELFVHRTSKGGIPIPKFWYGNTQEAMRRILTALGRKFRSDPSLIMVMVPQMTQDGVSAKFKNLPAPYTTLTEAGFTKPLWQDALMWTMHSAIHAFPNKAIGIDLQEMVGDDDIARFIMQAINKDPKLKRQMMITSWWLNGKKEQQPKLISLLKRFASPMMGVVLFPSYHKWAFHQKGYPMIFKQAQNMGMRAIALSSHEFNKHTMDKLLRKFSIWSEQTFHKHILEGRR